MADENTQEGGTTTDAGTSAASVTSSTLSSGDIVGDPTLTTSRDAGAAATNAVYPSPSTGATSGATTDVSDADVSDMNIDRGIGNDVPNVRSEVGSSGNDLPNVQSGGTLTSEATRGLAPETARAITSDANSDDIHDKTGERDL